MLEKAKRIQRETKDLYTAVEAKHNGRLCKKYKYMYIIKYK